MRAKRERDIRRTRIRESGGWVVNVVSSYRGAIKLLLMNDAAWQGEGQAITLLPLNNVIMTGSYTLILLNRDSLSDKQLHLCLFKYGSERSLHISSKLHKFKKAITISISLILSKIGKK